MQVQRESQTLATITFQNYFRMYDKLAGMTGTAKTEEQEFIKIYGLEVFQVPTNRPVQRKDLPDVILRRNVASTGRLSVKLKGATLPGSQCLLVQRLLNSRNN